MKYNEIINVYLDLYCSVQEAQRAAKTQQQAEKVKTQEQTPQQKLSPSSGKPILKDSIIKGPEKPLTSTKLVNEVSWSQVSLVSLS